MAAVSKHEKRGWRASLHKPLTASLGEGDDDNKGANGKTGKHARHKSEAK